MLSNRLFEIFERFPNVAALAFSENRVQSRLISTDGMWKIWCSLIFAFDFVLGHIKLGVAGDFATRSGVRIPPPAPYETPIQTSKQT
jgi:hypothetical protein